MYKYLIPLIITFINVLPNSAKTINAEIGSFNYELDTETKTASAVNYIYYNCGSGGTIIDFGKVEVPAYINYKNTEYTVVELGYNCFWNCKNVYEITIPQTIKNIVTSNYDLPSLKKIKVKDLECWCAIEMTGSITNHLFSLEVNGVNLEQLTIPNDVKELSRYVFSYTDIKKVVVPKHIEEIPEQAFQGCTNLEYAELNSKKIGYNAFMDCSKLSEVYIKDQTLVSR